MEPETGDGPEPSELSLGFAPDDPSIIVPQIQRLAMTSRTLGFETIVNCTERRSPAMDKLVQEGLIQLVISSINETNLKIIGVVVTALRHLSAVYTAEFEALIPSIPFEFLLTRTSSSEVIDFLEQSAFNFDGFAAALLSAGDHLANAVSNWLQAGEATARATLELLATLAQVPNAPFDFGCVKPFLDGNFSPDIRALTLNVLLQADKQNWQEYLKRLMEIFFNEEDSGTVVELLHDMYIEQKELFEPHLPQILERLVQRIQLPGAAVLLADIAPKLDEKARENVIQLLFTQELTIERIDAIYRICGECQVRLPNEFVAALGDALVSNESAEVLMCVAALLEQYPEFFASEAGQEKLHQALQRPFDFAVIAFKLCVNCCSNCPVAGPLMEAFHSFATEYEKDMDEELHAAVAAFCAAHK